MPTQESQARTATELREEIRQWLDEHEGKDDWGVVYVYTAGLRELLGLPGSSFKYSWEE